MQFLASRKVYLKDNNMVENQWVRIWSTEWLKKQIFSVHQNFMDCHLNVTSHSEWKDPPDL